MGGREGSKARNRLESGITYIDQLVPSFGEVRVRIPVDRNRHRVNATPPTHSKQQYIAWRIVLCRSLVLDIVFHTSNSWYT